jgi:hypothetical protein
MVPWRRHAAIMIAIVVLAGAATIWWGERIGVNDGEGWDGQAYVEWSQSFFQRVVDTGLTHYHAQRVLPSATVAALGSVLGVAPTIANHIVLFAWLGLALLVVAAVVWLHLAFAVMRWSPSAAWDGFIALFGCFANARHALYYPALTDVAAFTLGMCLVWGYLARKASAVWCVGLLAAWTWPALVPLAIVMLVLPRPSAETGDAPPPTRLSRARAAILALLATAAFIAVALFYLGEPVPNVGDEKFAEWVRRDWLPITLVLLAAQLLAGWYVLLLAAKSWRVRAYVKQLDYKSIAFAIVAAAAIVVLRGLWLEKVGVLGDGPSTQQFLCEQTLAALRGPLWGPVHHIVYFGPIVAIALLVWRRVARVADDWGPAFVIALVMVVAFFAASNSRQWNHLFPVLVTVTIAATARAWTPASVGWFAILAVVWSKVWLRIGYDHNSGWHTFPQDNYFMNHGPYASDLTWAIHLAAAVATIVAMIVFSRYRRWWPASGS